MESVMGILEELNPGWSNPEWHTKDDDIQQAVRSGIERRIRYRFREKWIKHLLSSHDAWGIRVIRGPRRIGKTTLMKLLIKDAIDSDLHPKAITYITLDNVDLREAIDKGIVSLRKLLIDIIKDKIERYGKTILIIDEAIFYDKWAVVDKNLVDEHVIRPRVILLVTGS